MSGEGEQFLEGLFFIVGTGRCGSTLLQAMLSCHPRIHVTPETKFFSFFDPAMYLGEPFGSREALERHVERCRENVYWRDLALDEGRLIEETAAGGLTSRSMLVAILRQFHERGGKARLGEKTPAHFKAIDRIREMFPRARFIHIARDPRDFVASMLRVGWGGHSSAMLHARTWRKVMEADERHERELGPDYMRLRYEDLVAQPEESLRRVCEFLGEEFDASMLGFHARDWAGFGESEMEWKGGTLEPLTRSGIGRHRESLTAHQVRTVEHVCGRQMERLGYERDRDLEDRAAWRVADAMESVKWWLARQRRSVRKRLSPPDPYERISSSAMARTEST